jgi:ribosome maturation factor RimP
MTEQGRGNVADAVREVVGPVVTSAGLWLEDVQVSRAGARSVVRIVLDLPEDAVGSLDSDTLGEASREVSAALDADDVVPGVYTLEVSTPGTSRPLTQLRHFRRARTRLVTLQLADGGSVTGRLTDVVDDGDGPALVLDDGARVPLDRVRKGKVEVELKRLEDDDDADGDAAADDAGEPRTQEG